VSTSSPRGGDDPEAVIRQAMRAMAGGRRDEVGRGSRDGQDPGGGRGGWSVTQILLLAAIVGLVLGMGAAFGVLLTR